MKMLITITIIFLCFTKGLSQNFLISGKIVDEKNNPVSFATIYIAKANNNKTYIAEKIADEAGLFKIPVAAGEYVIKITAVSFSDFTKNIQITSSLDNLSFTLSKKENELSSVTVTARKPFITRKIDRVVMDVQNNALSAGKSSLELFQMAPGVFVLNGNISINGNSATRVMVDGKLLHLGGDDLTNYLNSLRAEDIQSIEVIAHPPAEYDAEGTGGLINIILKRNKNYGLNGSVNAGYSQGRYAGTNEGIRLGYKEKKLSLFANYSYSHGKDFDDYILTRTATSTQNYQSTDNSVSQYTNHNVGAGCIYDIDKKQYIGLEYNGYFSNNNKNTNATSIITNSNYVLNQSVKGNYPNKLNSNMNGIGLNYHHNLDSVGSNYTFLTDYTTFSTKQNNGVQSNFYDYEETFLNDTLFKFYIPCTFKIFTAELKFKKVLNKSSVLNFGGKITATSIDNSSTYNSFSNNVWVNDTALDYVYKYNENIYAAYGSYNGKMKNLEYQLGLRGEYTYAKSDLVSRDSVNTNRYFSLFPSVYLKYPVNKGGNDFVTASYTRRVNRPSFNSLNPFQYYVDNYSIGEGNPRLQPSFENSYELGYTYYNKYSVSLFYAREKDMVAQYVTISPGDSLLAIYKMLNLGKKISYGIYINSLINVTKWWNMNNDFTLREDDHQLQDLDLKRTVVEIKTNQSFTLPKQYSINLSAFYINHEIDGSFVINPIFTMNIGAQKKLLKNKLIIKAAFNDVFNSLKINADIYYSANSVGKMIKREQRQTFNLSAIYNFNLGKAFRIKTLEHSNADEKNRL